MDRKIKRIVGMIVVLMLVLFLGIFIYMENYGKIPRKVQMENGTYVPISEGWKESKSVSGDLTEKQKKEIDSMVEVWKKGTYSDAELKEELALYLIAEKVPHVEISVKSKSQNLLDEIPDIEMENGGNLYSFMGIYSTGEQNPEGTNKTVCHQWSVFIF